MNSNEGSDDSSDDEHPCMSNWNRTELETLLHFVRQDNFDIQELQEHIPLKSEKDISEALNYCAAQADTIIKSKSEPLKCRKKKDYKQDENIVQWLNFMMESYDLRKIISGAFGDALATIATSASTVDGVNFQRIYMYMSKAMKGETLPNMNNETRFVFNQCLRECIKIAKNEIKNNPDLVHHLQKLERADLVGDLPDPSDMNASVFFKNLLIKEAFNPLKIPVELLKETPYVASSGEE